MKPVTKYVIGRYIYYLHGSALHEIRQIQWVAGTELDRKSAEKWDQLHFCLALMERRNLRYGWISFSYGWGLLKPEHFQTQFQPRLFSTTTLLKIKSAL